MGEGEFLLRQPQAGQGFGGRGVLCLPGAWGGSPLNSEDAASDTQFRCRRRTANGQRGVCASPQRRPQKDPRKCSQSPEPHDDDRDGRYEICAYRDILQVVELQGRVRGAYRGGSTQPQSTAPLPRCWLFVGWMNEIQAYDPETCQLSLTHSVYATLEGSRLRLAYPRASVPRRAAFDETPPEAVFVRSRTYQLVDCKVSLLPSVLARKRVWNRKYPICLALAEGVQVEEEVEGEEEDVVVLLPGSEDDGERAAERQASPESHAPDTLYLFGRTGREKEEWFQHFLAASRDSRLYGSPSKEESKAGTKSCRWRHSERKHRGVAGVAPKAKVLLDYAAYMSHLIGHDSGSPTPSPCPSDPGSPAATKKFSAEECICEGGGEDEPGAESGPGGSFAEVHPAWVNSLVSLLPSVLARKRVWNRKYPICLALAEGVQVEEEVEGEEEDVVVLLPGSEDDGERAAERQASPESHAPDTLYLFGRTGREKEEWFQHFLAASRDSRLYGSPSKEESKAESLVGGDTVRESTEESPGVAPKAKVLLDYAAYMSHLIGHDSGSPTPSPCPSDPGSPAATKKFSAEECICEGGGEDEPGAESGPGGSFAEVHPAWVNSLVGRIFWDFLREKYWSDKVAHKIQKKLSKIRDLSSISIKGGLEEEEEEGAVLLMEHSVRLHREEVVVVVLMVVVGDGWWWCGSGVMVVVVGVVVVVVVKLPYFMNELKLAELDMGTGLPEVLSTSKPSLDQRGLWLELDVAYMGGLQMTLETKMNLCKLGKEGGAEAHRAPETCREGDEESSSAGSSDEEDLPPAEPQGSPGDKGAPSVVGADGHAGGSTGRKILRFVDKITKSKYFQKATENEYIKKKIAEVSNMPLMLAVEVLELSGTLAGPPRLDLHVRPMLGEREVTFSHVTEWIERKLQCEFQKVFVMPNMDDLYLPLMTPGVDNPPPSHPSPAQPSSSRQSSVDSQEYMSE
ncbi:hypothetical protein CRUP_004463 [Coryphaenoides rupestris]|nr:hypothetical protein CRUP_004463 [Coryphaenoides rupestris]